MLMEENYKGELNKFFRVFNYEKKEEIGSWETPTDGRDLRCTFFFFFFLVFIKLMKQSKVPKTILNLLYR